MVSSNTNKIMLRYSNADEDGSVLRNWLIVFEWLSAEANFSEWWFQMIINDPILIICLWYLSSWISWNWKYLLRRWRWVEAEADPENWVDESKIGLVEKFSFLHLSFLENLIKKLNWTWGLGSSCCTGVEQMPHNHEVVGSNTTGCLALFILLHISAESSYVSL